MASSGMMAEQRDELELLEAMRREEEELSWEETKGHFAGVMRVEVDLAQPLSVSLAKLPVMKTAKAMAASQGALQPVSVSHLPPICLHFQLPPDYPACAPPQFSLACSWLNYSQLSKLCRALDQLWLEGEGSVILYQWQQLLTHETFSLLNISSQLVVDVEPSIPQMVDWDTRAVQEIEHPLMVLPALVEYDLEWKEKEFKKTVFECEICFESVLGVDCIQLSNCQHVHCCQCMREHTSAKIHDGQVARVDCPSIDCSELVPPNVIKRLVSPSLYTRYDQLLLQQSLEGMVDIVYCPRPSCRCATVKEEEDGNMAVCSRCQFSFCVLCKRTWHGISPCKLLPDDVRELKEMYESGDSELRESLEQQYGKKQLQRAMAEVDSHDWIKTNAKKCPGCNSNIEKSHGCNKMTCLRCGHHFCWLCQTELDKQNPYRHFHLGASACGGRLFDGMALDEDEVPGDD